MSKRLVVIGGVAAGMSAAAKAKRSNPELEVVAFEKSHYVSYGACGLPYYLAGWIENVEKLVARTPEKFAKQGVTALVRHEVVEVDYEGRRVRVAALDEGREFWQPFDYLVVSTGARPVVPPLEGAGLEGVFTLRQPEDGVAIRAALADARRTVIVGGGYVGLEVAEAFRAQGKEVTLIELEPRVLPGADPEVSELVREELERNGVEVLTGTRVEAFAGDGRVERVVTSAGELPADLVLLSVGIRPNVELATSFGVATGPTGAIAVDEQLRTNLESVWAAGDVAESRHLLTGQPYWLPLGDVANKHGRTAGTVIAGKKAAFKGVVGSAITKVFERAIAFTGLSEADAKAAGFDAKSVWIKSADRAHYYPNPHPLHVKLVYEAGSGRLLGAQLVGHFNDALRIDVVATLLHRGGTVEDLRALDLAYAPPFSPVWDPLLVAANQAR
ncbi:FAD-dependent oxidoreductase [Oceanithermus sp.]|uniref:FAD-dependent oxidoreductase n=1 Tax=Oceanithermus sp. TaxID=2268145 RepID=UPI0025EBD078|nr:FAD-dependent oxidoreductase [Oceanithermus sp.]